MKAPSLRLFGSCSAPMKPEYAIELLLMRIHFFAMCIAQIASGITLFNALRTRAGSETLIPVVCLAVVLFFVLLYMFRVNMYMYGLLLLICIVGATLRFLNLMELPSSDFELLGSIMSAASTWAAWRVRHLKPEVVPDEILQGLTAFTELAHINMIPEQVAKAQTMLQNRKPGTILNEKNEPVPPITVGFWALTNVLTHDIVYGGYYDEKGVFTEQGKKLMDALDFVTQAAITHHILEKEHVAQLKEAVLESIDENKGARKCHL